MTKADGWGEKLTRCRRCNAEVILSTSRKGNVIVLDRATRQLHFKTCKYAEQFKREYADRQLNRKWQEKHERELEKLRRWNKAAEDTKRGGCNGPSTA